MTRIVKRGHEMEIAKLLKEQIRDSGHTARVYTPYLSPVQRIVLEMEFETLAEFETFVAQAATASSEAYKKMIEFGETGGYDEVWRLVD
jgi:hypothetical protein